MPSPALPRVAFKEWAAICRALATGRQDVILRKGGIAEPGGGFRVAAAEFLLLPTFLHQAPESLVPGARDLLVDIDADRPPAGSVAFHHRARIIDAAVVTSLDDLGRWRSRHVWSDTAVAERFHRWKDELQVLVVAVAPLAEPLVLPWQDDYGGCKSWVDLHDAPDSKAVGLPS
jgi:hypothetical protein